MRLSISHETTYHYDDQVRASIQYLRLTPHDSERQHVLSWQLDLPRPVRAQVDPFGNILHVLTLDEPHDAIIIGARGQVDIDELREAEHESQSAYPFLRSTHLTEADDALRGFAEQHCHQRRDRTALIDLMQALNHTMVYTPGATEVDTRAAQAFAGRAGVCQDHTHAFLACARSLGIPARYVSGYLYSEDSTHLASHAWAEAWLDDAWYSFDVTNQLARPERHLKLAVGLDYLDACPVRGMRRGGGHEQMHAKVFVAPTPKPSWFDDLNAQLTAAQSLAQQWVDTLGPQVTKTIPLQVINFGANFTAATNAILQIAKANPQAQGANDPSVVEIKMIIQQTLLPPIQSVITQMTQVSTALTTWGDSMQASHNNLASGTASIQAAETSLKSDIEKMNNAIQSLHTEIDGENKAIAYSAAAIGIGIFALVVGIALAPETGGTSLLIGGFIGAAGIIGGSVTWGIMQSKINAQFDQIAQDQQELNDDQRQITALQGLQLASQNVVSSIEMATSTLSRLTTQWGTFQGELEDVVAQLESAEQAVSTIVQSVFTSAVQTEWGTAIDTANNLVNAKVEIQTQTVPMAAAQAA